MVSLTKLNVENAPNQICSCTNEGSDTLKIKKRVIKGNEKK